jgi:16S rRNA (cytosine967-C5)-methyltransferase
LARARKAASPRVLAARILREIERRRGFSNRVLSEHLERAHGLDPRDRGLVTHLVYGVLRHRTRMDRHIDAHARRPSGLKGEIRQILRVGVLELLELSHPPHAVLAEAGRAALALQGGVGMRGVTQAILKGVAEHGAELDRTLDAAAPVAALAGRWSIPEWIGAAWVAELGEERARARARAIAQPPPLDLRVDLHRTDRETVLARLAVDHPRARIEAPEHAPAAIRMHGGGDVFHGPLHAEGLVSVQGLGAQAPAQWLAPEPGARVLDACAGMGGKTQQLAELMHRRGEIVAADADAKKLAEIDALKRRAALDVPGLSILAVAGELQGHVPALDDGAPFDAVLLDAPCTGLGNLARHPEIRWWRTPEDVPARASLQVALLSACLRRVRTGGPLVYAVCSFAPEEGPAVVREVAAKAGVGIEDERTLTPELDATEGFYVARLRW